MLSRVSVPGSQTLRAVRQGGQELLRSLHTSGTHRNRKTQPTGRAGHVSPWQRVPFFHERGPPVGMDKNLQERLDELRLESGAGVPEEEQVDIGFAREVRERSSKAQVAEWRRRVRGDRDLERRAREGTLSVDLDTVRREWRQGGTVFQDIFTAAQLYGIFEDTFQHASFMPCLHLDISYPGDGVAVPVHRGNIVKPHEAARQPEVSWVSKEDTLWTLAMVSLDSHLTSPGQEYLHWLVGNIKGSDLASGHTLANYLQPFPPFGTGFHRFVFILYHQDTNIDFSVEQRNVNHIDLDERTFKTFDFYTRYQENLTPAGLAFFQSDYDLSLRDFFHNTLEMKEPRYEYEFPEPYVAPWNDFYGPGNSKGFNDFLDRHRDPKDVAQEVLVAQLGHTDPFRGDLEKLEMKYPGIHMEELNDVFPPPLLQGEKPFMRRQAYKNPSWWKEEVRKSRMREGKHSAKQHLALRRDPGLTQ